MFLFCSTSYKQVLSSYKVMSYSIPSSFQFPFLLSHPFSVTCLWLFCFNFAVIHRSTFAPAALINIAFMVAKLGNACIGSKNVFDLRQTNFPGFFGFCIMSFARLHLKTFDCATMFPSLARPCN